MVKKHWYYSKEKRIFWSTRFIFKYIGLNSIKNKMLMSNYNLSCRCVDYSKSFFTKWMNCIAFFVSIQAFYDFPNTLRSDMGSTIRCFINGLS